MTSHRTACASLGHPRIVPRRHWRECPCGARAVTWGRR